MTTALMPLQGAQAGEPRIWKSNKGTSINAELLFVGKTLVVFKTDKGKEISTPINSLSPEDIAYLKQLNEKPKVTSNVEEKITPAEKMAPKATEEKIPTKKTAQKEDELLATKEARLDTLKDGKGKGMHAYYEGENYVAKVNNKGFLMVYCKDDTGNIDERWRLLIRAKSLHRIDNSMVHFPFEKILTGNPAKPNATEIKYTFESKSGIKSDVILEFSPDGFTTWTRSEEGSSTPEDMIHIMSHHIGTMENVSKDQEYLKKIKFKRTLVEGKRERLDFSENVKISGDTEECEITGSFFGQLKLKFKRAGDDEAKLTPSQYPGSPLSQGFSMNTIKTDSTTNRHNSEKVTITFK